MKILFTHPIGNANVRAILNGLSEQGHLHSFYTSLATYPNNVWDLMSRVNIFNELQRRKFNPSLEPFTHMYPYKELGRMLALKLKINRFTKHETGIFSIDEVFTYIGNKVVKVLKEKNSVDGIYTYEDGALEVFRQAKKNGIKCIYDLPIAYWEIGRQLMSEESERLPIWSDTLAGGIKDSKRKLERKTEEMELADIIIVPSKFVKDSLPGNMIFKPIILSPFGSPNASISVFKKRKTDKLRVLFAGSMGQRKGLGDLFEAFKILGNENIELVVMGSPISPMAFYKKQFSNFIYEPPRPHNDVLELMRTCDVFCLPSIVEGRALVMQEAMSQGLPLIITPNTGGEDLIVEGETGFLVPIRSPEKIAEKILWFSENKEQLAYMSKMAQQLAETYTWNKYSETIINGLKDHIDS